MREIPEKLVELKISSVLNRPAEPMSDCECPDCSSQNRSRTDTLAELLADNICRIRWSARESPNRVCRQPEEFSTHPPRSVYWSQVRECQPVKWLKRKTSGSGRRKESERRAPRQSTLTQVETLESRLCLGSMSEPGCGNVMPEFGGTSQPAEVSQQIVTSSPAPDAEDDLEELWRSSPAEAEKPQRNVVVENQDGILIGDVEPVYQLLTNTDVGQGLNADDEDESVVEPSRAAIAPAVAEKPIQEFGESVTVTPGGGVSTGGAATAAEIDNPGEVTADTLAQNSDDGGDVRYPAWWGQLDEPVTLKYDFRDIGVYENYITLEQQTLAEQAFDEWSRASGGKLQFERDTSAADYEVINVGVGELEVAGEYSMQGGTLGLGGGTINATEDGSIVVGGLAWLDVAETWDDTRGNGDVDGTVDFFTVAAHEIGHSFGMADSNSFNSQDIMRGFYDGERDGAGFDFAVQNGEYFTTVENADPADAEYSLHKMQMFQLTGGEVELLLRRASSATTSQDAVIAVVDRGGTILGVQAEQGVINTIDTSVQFGGDNNGAINTAGEQQAFAFFVEGAVAKARTAAFFSNGDPTNVDQFSPGGTLAPLTSRLVRFISQTTITQREVQARATVDANFDATQRGPGFVAPIGTGGHFPPEVRHTPPVDLFMIENTNRDRLPLAVGNNAGQKNPNSGFFGGAAVDANPANIDAATALRFNIPYAAIDPAKLDALREPLSFGEVTGLDPNARSRGIATLPGGIPLFRDTNGDGVGETLVGGIGVFFPGPNGFADFEQGFKPGIQQSEYERTNAPKVLEAEAIAFAAIGGSALAGAVGIPHAANVPVFDAAGQQLPRVNGLDLPFGRLDLVGITLQVVGPIAGRQGVGEVIQAGLRSNLLGQNAATGVFVESSGNMTAVVDSPVGQTQGVNFLGGRAVPTGFVVPPRDGVGINQGEVTQIINNAIAGAQRVRAAVRLRGDTVTSGARTRMVIAVTDLEGAVVGLFVMQDATVFSIDVAVAKARNTAYYADPAELQAQDQVPGVQAGTAFTNRTFRFLAEPRFPSGVDGDPPGVFSELNNPFINPFTAENNGLARPDTDYRDTVVGRDVYNPTTPGIDQNTNFSDPDAGNNQNGVVFFPGSTPLYRNGVLIGGFGISGDGVDQDDVVTFIGAQGFLPNQNGVTRSDQIRFRDVALPYQKFLRNPFG